MPPILVLTVFFVVETLMILSWPKPKAPQLGISLPLYAASCSSIVERFQVGAVCLPNEELQRLALGPSLGLDPGTIVSENFHATSQRMLPQRLFLAGIKLDINQATMEELVALPGIGPGLAQAIVHSRTNRPLRCAADLQRIAGLGASRIARIQPFLQPLRERCLPSVNHVK